MAIDFIVKGNEWVNVRAAPSMDAAIIGGIQTGDTVKVNSVINGWGVIDLNGGTATLRGPGDLTQRLGYMKADLMASTDVPVVTYPTVTFTATPTTIVAGETVTLAWNVQNVNAVRLDDAAEAGVMTRTRTPLVDTTYTLTVEYKDSTTQDFKQKVTVTPAPAVATSKTQLIVNTVIDAEGANAAVNAGCQGVSMTFNADYAAKIRQFHPNLIVAARGCWYKGSPPDTGFFDEKLGPAMSANNVYIMGVNESDNGYGTSVDDIKKRIDFDRKMLEHVKSEASKRGTHLIYCGGGFSAGEPDITNESVIQAMAGYGALLLDPCFAFNQHTYATDDHAKDITVTKIRDLVFDESNGIGPTRRFVNGKFETFNEHIYRTDWTITRWRMYYRRCGWPTKNSLGLPTMIVSDETGIDIGSVGGFNSCPGVDDAFLQKWARKWVEIQSMPFDIGNGIMEPSHLLWGAIFQCGPNADWRGYDISTKLAAFQACAWGQK